MTVRWASLFFDAAGEFDANRARATTATLLGLLGGAVLVAGAVLELATRVDIPTAHVLITGGILVAPVTGGKLMEMAKR